MSNLFQDTKTGKLVEFISKHDKDYAMVRDAGGNVTYLTLEQLVPYDKKKGRLDKIEAQSCKYLKSYRLQLLCPLKIHA